MKKNQKNMVHEKNSAKFCPKTQPSPGFSLKNITKNLSVWKKLIFQHPKLTFDLMKNKNAPQAAGLGFPARKCTKIACTKDTNFKQESHCRAAPAGATQPRHPEDDSNKACKSGRWGFYSFRTINKAGIALL